MQDSVSLSWWWWNCDNDGDIGDDEYNDMLVMTN